MPSKNTPPSALQAVAETLKKYSRFAVIAHPRADADAIGSVLGLAYPLKAAGKQVAPLCQGPFTDQLRYLPGIDWINVWLGPQSWREAWSPEVVVVLDIGGLKRVEPFMRDLNARLFPSAKPDGKPGVGGLIGKDRALWLNLDHHISNDKFGDQVVLDDTACATAEIVFELLQLAKLPIPPEAAGNLYAGILTDTGSFNFNTTTPRALRNAAQLVELGANPAALARAAYRSKSLGLLKLEALTTQRIRTESDGRLAWSYIREADCKAAGQTLLDTGELVSQVSALSTIQIAAFFVDTEQPGGCKVSLRGEGFHNLSEIAQRHGGGGHARAAGITFNEPLDVVMPRLIAELTPLVSPAATKQW